MTKEEVILDIAQVSRHTMEASLKLLAKLPKPKHKRNIFIKSYNRRPQTKKKAGLITAQILLTATMGAMQIHRIHVTPRWKSEYSHGPIAERQTLAEQGIELVNLGGAVIECPQDGRNIQRISFSIEDAPGRNQRHRWIRRWPYRGGPSPQEQDSLPFSPDA